MFFRTPIFGSFRHILHNSNCTTTVIDAGISKKLRDFACIAQSAEKKGGAEVEIRAISGISDRLFLRIIHEQRNFLTKPCKFLGIWVYR